MDCLGSVGRLSLNVYVCMQGYVYMLLLCSAGGVFDDDMSACCTQHHSMIGWCWCWSSVPLFHKCLESDICG
jgi:hypothetical protein